MSDPEDPDVEYCDCVCECDAWDKAQMRGQFALIVLVLLLLSFVWTDGWMFNDC